MYFFLLVAGYYFLKPLSRGLYLTYLGADNLPYVWIATTLVLSIVIPLFQWKISRIHPLALILTLILSLTILLTFFRFILDVPGRASAFGFYVLVDVYSVLIIENFWSLTNASYNSEAGKKWYGLVGSGGLLGGLAASTAASKLIELFSFTPLDLIVISIGIFLLSMCIVLLMNKKGYVVRTEVDSKVKSMDFAEIYRSLVKSSYLRWITCLLLAAQLIEPLVEYQFMAAVQSEIVSLSDRTKYVSDIFAYTSLFGLFINLAFVPLVHTVGGLAAGLLLQPILIGLTTLTYFFWQSLLSVSLLKILDRGLAYSSGRASRELLYIPFDSTSIFKLKAWIDVYGYRLFKIFGSLLLLIVTRWASFFTSTGIITAAILLIVFIWVKVIIRIKSYVNSGS